MWICGNRRKIIRKGHTVTLNRFPPQGMWICTEKLTPMWTSVHCLAQITKPLSVPPLQLHKRIGWLRKRQLADILLLSLPHRSSVFLLLHPSLLFLFPTGENGKTLKCSYFQYYLFMWQTYHHLPVLQQHHQLRGGRYFPVLPAAGMQPSAHKVTEALKYKELLFLILHLLWQQFSIDAVEVIVLVCLPSIKWLCGAVSSCFMLLRHQGEMKHKHILAIQMLNCWRHLIKSLSLTYFIKVYSGQN